MNIDEIIKEQIKNLQVKDDLNSLSDYADNLTGGLSQEFTVDKILNATLNGESIFDSAEMISTIKELFFYEIKGALTVGIEILTICIIIGLLKNLSSSFGRKGISEIASLTASIVVIGLAMTCFNDVYQMTMDAVNAITYTMDVMLPIFIAILISMGQVVSGTLMSPLLITSITVFQTIIKTFVMPALFISTVFGLLNCLTEKDYVNKLSKFIRQTALFVTGLIITLLSGIIAIQGLIAKTGDSLIMGTAKYSLDAFIPIVGGFTSDTIELFLTCMRSIKNIFGIFGIILIILVIFTPIIKILAVAVIFKITALLAEPVTSKKISEGIGDIGTSLVAMGAILFFVSLLFIMFITSIIQLGGS